jgi:MFS family permease
VYTVLLCIGSIVGGLTGGYIAFNNSWDTLFWVSVALSAPCFLGVAFLVPETRFNRIPVGEQSTEVIATTIDANTKELAASQQIERIQAGKSHPPYGYIKSLGFSSPSGHFLDHFIQPWYTLALPGTWVVMLQYAGLVGGVVTIALIGAQLVAMPPYLWAANAGLINVGGLIGAVLGWMYTHVLSDSLTKRQAKRSHEGVAEPEDRLPTIFFPSAVATCGFFVFGFCAQYPGTYRWIGLEVGFGMLVFGLMQIPSIGFNYVSQNIPLPSFVCDQRSFYPR